MSPDLALLVLVACLFAVPGWLYWIQYRAQPPVPPHNDSTQQLPAKATLVGPVLPQRQPQHSIQTTTLANLHTEPEPGRVIHRRKQNLVTPQLQASQRNQADPETNTSAATRTRRLGPALPPHHPPINTSNNEGTIRATPGYPSIPQRTIISVPAAIPDFASALPVNVNPGQLHAEPTLVIPDQRQRPNQHSIQTRLAPKPATEPRPDRAIGRRQQNIVTAPVQNPQRSHPSSVNATYRGAQTRRLDPTLPPHHPLINPPNHARIIPATPGYLPNTQLANVTVPDAIAKLYRNAIGAPEHQQLNAPTHKRSFRK